MILFRYLDRDWIRIFLYCPRNLVVVSRRNYNKALGYFSFARRVKQRPFYFPPTRFPLSRSSALPPPKIWLHLTSQRPCWWKNNSEKSLLGIWLYYYAKRELHFSIVLAPRWPSYHVTAIKGYSGSSLLKFRQTESHQGRDFYSQRRCSFVNRMKWAIKQFHIEGTKRNFIHQAQLFKQRIIFMHGISIVNKSLHVHFDITPLYPQIVLVWSSSLRLVTSRYDLHSSLKKWITFVVSFQKWTRASHELRRGRNTETIEIFASF